MSPALSELDDRATRIYADFMGHLWGCSPCRREDYCRAGDRMRRAWKAAQGEAVRAYMESGLRAEGDGASGEGVRHESA